MGTVRMCPPLPIRSTTAQCPWRIWISPISKPTSSDRRKPQTKQHGQHGVIALGAQRRTVGVLQHFRAFLGAQPVAGAKSKLLYALHAADARRQLGTQQTRIGGLVRQPSNS